MAHFWVVFLLSGSLMASFTGTFKGRGLVKDGEGWSQSCPNMEIQTEESADEFKLIKLFFDCGTMRISQQPYTLQKDKGTLLDRGQVVGTINANQVVVDVTNTQGHFIWKVLRNVDGSLSYYDFTTLPTHGGYVEVRGTLY